MTIDASDFDSSARLVIENSVAVGVLPKVAINAVHPFLEMNVVEVARLLESIRILRRDDRIPCIEQVPFAIAFEYLTKQPAMAVRVGKLCALELTVEVYRARLIQKVCFRPQTAQAR